MSNSFSGRKRSRMPPPQTSKDKSFSVGQIVWVRVKGHPIWPGTVSFLPTLPATKTMYFYFQILVLPHDQGPGSKGKFQVDFFNNGDIAYVPSSGLFDFVGHFKTFGNKTIKRVSNFATHLLVLLYSFLINLVVDKRSSNHRRHLRSGRQSTC